MNPARRPAWSTVTGLAPRTRGGEGNTLEMRVFSESGVLADLRKAGFEDIRIHREPRHEFGIHWIYDWSLPITARRPASGR